MSRATDPSREQQLHFVGMTSHMMSVLPSASLPPSPAGCSPTVNSPRCALFPCQPSHPCPLAAKPQLCKWLCSSLCCPCSGPLPSRGHAAPLQQLRLPQLPSLLPAYGCGSPPAALNQYNIPGWFSSLFYWSTHPFGITSLSTQHSLSPPAWFLPSPAVAWFFTM